MILFVERVKRHLAPGIIGVDIVFPLLFQAAAAIVDRRGVIVLLLLFLVAAAITIGR